MEKRVINEEFRRMQSLAGVLNENIDLSDNTEKSLTQQLTKHKFKPGQVFTFVDDEGNKTEMTMDNSGNFVPADDSIDEVSKKDIITGIVCTMLATGMVSCTKPNTDGFGYNVNSKATEYPLDKGTPNKTITISTPKGDKEVEVDSNMADTKFYSGSQPLKFEKPMTPTQALIIKIGHAYQTEKNQNNRNTNRVWDYDPENSDITGGGTMYQDNETPFKSAEDHPLWKLGMEAAKNAGMDIDKILSKIKTEKDAGTYIK